MAGSFLYPLHQRQPSLLIRTLFYLPLWQKLFLLRSTLIPFLRLSSPHIFNTVWKQLSRSFQAPGRSTWPKK